MIELFWMCLIFLAGGLSGWAASALLSTRMDSYPSAIGLQIGPPQGGTTKKY